MIKEFWDFFPQTIEWIISKGDSEFFKKNRILKFTASFLKNYIEGGLNLLPAQIIFLFIHLYFFDKICSFYAIILKKFAVFTELFWRTLQLLRDFFATCWWNLWGFLQSCHNLQFHDLLTKCMVFWRSFEKICKGFCKFWVKFAILSWFFNGIYHIFMIH